MKLKTFNNYAHVEINLSWILCPGRVEKRRVSHKVCKEFVVQNVCIDNPGIQWNLIVLFFNNYNCNRGSKTQTYWQAIGYNEN